MTIKTDLDSQDQTDQKVVGDRNDINPASPRVLYIFLETVLRSSVYREKPTLWIILMTLKVWETKPMLHSLDHTPADLHKGEKCLILSQLLQTC